MKKPPLHPTGGASVPPVQNTKRTRNGQGETDPILSLRGTGKAIWANEDADAYLERLRVRMAMSRVFWDRSRKNVHGIHFTQSLDKACRKVMCGGIDS